MPSMMHLHHRAILAILCFFVCVTVLVFAVPHGDRPQKTSTETATTPTPTPTPSPSASASASSSASPASKASTPQAHIPPHKHEHEDEHAHADVETEAESDDVDNSLDGYFGGESIHPRELTDDTFEHDTQAATGSTTGKWFIKFYAPWCGHCKSLAPVWDRLAAELHGSGVIVAKLDATVHSATARRFSVTKYPTLKFIANGEVFDYEGGRTLDELKRFAVGGYQLTTPTKVPGEPTLWDALVNTFMALLKDVGVIFQHKTAAAVVVFLVGVSSGIIMAVTVFISCCEKSDVPPGCVPVFSRLPDGRLVRSGSMPTSQVQQMQLQAQAQAQQQQAQTQQSQSQTAPATAPSAEAKKKQ